MFFYLTFTDKSEPTKRDRKASKTAKHTPRSDAVKPSAVSKTGIDKKVIESSKGPSLSEKNVKTSEIKSTEKGNLKIESTVTSSKKKDVLVDKDQKKKQPPADQNHDDKVGDDKKKKLSDKKLSRGSVKSNNDAKNQNGKTQDKYLEFEDSTKLDKVADKFKSLTPPEIKHPNDVQEDEGQNPDEQNVEEDAEPTEQEDDTT